MAYMDFYPRPPCGGRPSFSLAYRTDILFLSTPSVWRATFGSGLSLANLLFLSTPSVWRATIGGHLLHPAAEISIHALRVEGDERDMIGLSVYHISIHALRVEGDRCSRSGSSAAGYFYPRPPCGGRPRSKPPISTSSAISIHALRVEGDEMFEEWFFSSWVFLSTPSVWRATELSTEEVHHDEYFYPRPPCGGRRGPGAC